MTHLLSIDPGKNLGWASFCDGSLNGCGVISDALDLDRLCGRLPRYDKIVLVIEKPQVYQGRKSKGDPNDLIDLAVQAGFVVGRLRPSKTVWPKPATWKGQVPKEVVERRVLAILTEQEKELVGHADVRRSVRHNMYDAIGIGLWHLGRYRR